MKTLYFDCSSGICGDMILAAFIDLGVPADSINAELGRLNLPECPKIVSKKKRHVISGTTADVEFNKDAGQKNRSYSEIKRLLEDSPLDEYVKEKSLSMFRIIGEAEAKVHGVPLEKVHFHEVGAVDSIADIVGCAYCFSKFKDFRIYFSGLPMGSGTVNSHHGSLPLPAPAAALILEGIPIYGTDIRDELVTPTGAIIVKEFARGFSAFPSTRFKRCGTGFAKNRLEGLPGVLRIFEGELESSFESDTVMVIEANIDNFNPEYYGLVQEKLFDAGALDVTITPVIMKKGRPGNILSAICHRESLDKISDCILAETSTIGIRYHECSRKKLRREDTKIETPYGLMKAKKVFINDSFRIHPEFEELKRVSKEKNIPIVDLQNEINCHLSPKKPLKN